MKRGLKRTLCATLIGSAALYTATDGFRAITAEGARRLFITEQRPVIPPISVETMAGSLLPLRPENGEIVLVEFIYATCPTICRAAGEDFAVLRDHLRARQLNARLISVSFDPLADDLEVLKDYGEQHGASGNPWTIARLREADLSRVLDFFGVTVIPDAWGGYQHNAAVLLINAEGELSGVFDTDAVEAIGEAVASWS